jgi:hypothetical protein
VTDAASHSVTKFEQLRFERSMTSTSVQNAETGQMAREYRFKAF